MAWKPGLPGCINKSVQLYERGRVCDVAGLTFFFAPTGCDMPWPNVTHDVRDASGVALCSSLQHVGALLSYVELVDVYCGQTGLLFFLDA